MEVQKDFLTLMFHFLTGRFVSSLAVMEDISPPLPGSRYRCCPVRVPHRTGLGLPFPELRDRRREENTVNPAHPDLPKKSHFT